ncbi:hypothetical protein NDA13_002865 [Ustilago tritici]|nr:hypothetical protein NDA13_002865 [Ustilago tritici]
MSLSPDPWDSLYNGMLPFHEHFRHTLSQITILLSTFGHSSQHTKEHAQMYKAIENLEKYVGEVSKALRSGKVREGELEEVFDYAKIKKLVDGLRDVLLLHLEAEEASLRAPVVKAAGFELGEIRNLIR